MSKINRPTRTIKRAIRWLGGQSEVARIFNVSQMTVWRWINEGRGVPEKYVQHMLDLLGKGRMTPEQLRAPAKPDPKIAKRVQRVIEVRKQIAKPK